APPGSPAPQQANRRPQRRRPAPAARALHRVQATRGLVGDTAQTGDGRVAPVEPAAQLADLPAAGLDLALLVGDLARALVELGAKALALGRARAALRPPPRRLLAGPRPRRAERLDAAPAPAAPPPAPRPPL